MHNIATNKTICPLKVEKDNFAGGCVMHNLQRLSVTHVPTFRLCIFLMKILAMLQLLQHVAPFNAFTSWGQIYATVGIAAGTAELAPRLEWMEC